MIPLFLPRLDFLEMRKTNILANFALMGFFRAIKSRPNNAHTHIRPSDDDGFAILKGDLYPLSEDFWFWKLIGMYIHSSRQRMAVGVLKNP